MTEEVWDKAFGALRVRLALAELEISPAKQWTGIAAAIIVPKLMYVGRQAWSTEEIAKAAALTIRDFDWNAVFTMSDRAPQGWIKTEVAEQVPGDGGIGIPILKRNSSHRVQQWWGIGCSQQKPTADSWKYTSMWQCLEKSR